MESLSRFTPRQRLYVGMAIVAGCALLLWRPSFPYWMRPEYYEQLKITEFASDVELIMRGREDLVGHPILVVGDSMVALWPFEADVISTPAGYPLPLRDHLEQVLGDRHYDMIVMWVGTAALAHQRPWHPVDPADMVAGLRALADTAKRYTDRPVLITPMEVPGLQYYGITERLLEWKDVEVFDSRGIRVAGGTSMYLKDNFHLSKSGFAELSRQMAKHGIEVRKQENVAQAKISEGNATAATAAVR